MKRRSIDVPDLHAEIKKWAESNMYKDWVQSIPVLQKAIKTLESLTEDISDEKRQQCEAQGATGYWMPTRQNAIKPLYQLLALAQMRPDGVWDGD